MPDPVDPNDNDKQTFMQCVLGGQTWKKVYSLMDDQLAVTIRQLTPAEVDACFQQTHSERNRGLHPEPSDFYEQLLRYRMCLQLVDVRSGENLIPFPESMDTWEGVAVDPDPTTLPQIMKDVYAKVIHTESMNRILSTMTAKFNRLVSKLEVNVESPDFWKETKSPA